MCTAKKAKAPESLESAKRMRGSGERFYWWLLQEASRRQAEGRHLRAVGAYIVLSKYREE